MNQPNRKPLEYGGILLALYTSFIVAFAEGTPFPYLLTLPVAIFGLVQLSRKSAWRLPAAAGFILGLLAFAMAFTELMTGTVEARLTVGAHLTVYLSCIILVMRKGLVEFRWLYALCVVQAAIGAVLLGTVTYGILLLIFLLMALWNLSVVSMVRSQERFQVDTDEDDSATPVQEHSLLQPSAATSAIQMEGNERWLSKRFVGSVLGIGFGSICFGFIFFLLIPRYWIGSRSWGGEGDDDSSGITGFSENVSLGSYGTMLQSNEVVLEVRFFDPRDRPVQVSEYASRLGQSEPFFRGHTLDIYDNGKWSTDSKRLQDADQLEDYDSSVTYDVRQEYRLRAIGSRVLFAVRPNVADKPRCGRALTGHRHLLHDRHDSTLLASIQPRSRNVYRYEIFTQRYASQPGRGALRVHREISDGRLRDQLEQYLREEVGLKPREASNPGLRSSKENEKRADKIVKHLRDSGEYSYTLNIPQREFRDVDPVIEFLTKTRTGHCEYYATALVLLLRADGIPARLVGGFKGGEVNALTGFFEVQQRHAHAWVEAYIGRRWITLDATPSNERADAVDSVAGFWRNWRNFKQFFRFFWSTYILEMNYTQQNRSVYAPLKDTAKDAWNSLSQERKGTAAGLSALKEFLSDPSRWFSWQGGLLSFGLLWLLVSIVWAVKRVWRLFRTIGKEGLAFVRSTRTVDFYERFRRLCESVGVVRSPFQTQREFALDFAGRFPASSSNGYGPAELASAFYSVRFGDKEIPAEERRSIDRCLTELEASLKSKPA